MTSFRSLLFTQVKLLALPWRLATYQPPGASPARQRQGSWGMAEEDVEWGVASESLSQKAVASNWRQQLMNISPARPFKSRYETRPSP